MKLHRCTALPVIVLSVFVVLSCSGDKERGLKYPSEIDEQITDSIMTLVYKGEITTQEEFNAARDKYALMFVDSIRTDSLERYERYNYADILFWAGQKKKARSIFIDLRKGDDAEARSAARSLITMKIEELEFQTAEKMMTDYRKDFPLNPEYTHNLYSIAQDLAGRYNEMNKPEDAIRIFTEELDFLSFDAPYPSFNLSSEVAPLIMETGHISEFTNRIMQYTKNLEIFLNKHIDTTVYDDSTLRKDDEVVQHYENIIGGFESVIDRLNLIGKKKRGMKFLHVCNADSNLTMADFDGNVIVIDFWTTWCAPCVIGFKELNRIYSDYKDKHIVILGVTSFQGIFYNMETGHKEGSADVKISEEKEIKLTMEYMNKHHMVWPCVFSDRSFKDSGYASNGVPTTVIIDRDGYIRYIQMGIGQEQNIRRMLDKLLL